MTLRKRPSRPYDRERRPPEPPPLPLLALACLLGCLALFFVLALAGRAEAGSYTVAQCDRGERIGRADASFSGRGGYVGRARCERSGLRVGHESRRARRGQSGGWRLAAPPGTRITRLGVRLTGISEAGHVARLELAGAEPAGFTARRAGRRIEWSGRGGRSLWAGLRCTRRRCGAGERATVGIRAIRLTLHDAVAPRIAAAGSLLSGTTARGVERVEISAGDVGSGIRRTTVEVNGQVVNARVADCAKRGGIATRLSPCPNRAEPRFVLDTRSDGFVQGPNLVRACAGDWASRSRSAAACQAERVRVDNACPTSELGGGIRIEARITRAGRRAEARVTGRLLGASGAGLGGRTVCIATRIRLAGRPEHVLATPRTDPGGGFSVALGRGPSREVRIAHWPDEERVAERILQLSEPARPRLRVRPRSTRNGRPARFRVALPGPRRAGVKVRIEARSGRRWVELRSGRTDRRGVLRARYRFRSTTETRRYAFRAAVPRQSGYPYAAGRSQTRTVRVRP